MTDTAEFIEDFLAHRYDAEYAHEYYMRTRKLKGRPRVEEDEVPTRSPSGARLVDYDGTGQGRALYSDGSTYDGRGWNADRVARSGSIERDEQQSNNSNRTPRARSRNERDDAQSQNSAANTYARTKTRNERDEEQSDRSNRSGPKSRIEREEQRKTAQKSRREELQNRLTKALKTVENKTDPKSKEVKKKLLSLAKKLDDPFKTKTVYKKAGTHTKRVKETHRFRPDTYKTVQVKDKPTRTVQKRRLRPDVVTITR